MGRDSSALDVSSVSRRNPLVEIVSCLTPVWGDIKINRLRKGVIEEAESRLVANARRAGNLYFGSLCAMKYALYATMAYQVWDKVF